MLCNCRSHLLLLAEYGLWTVLPCKSTVVASSMRIYQVAVVFAEAIDGRKLRNAVGAPDILLSGTSGGRWRRPDTPLWIMV